MGQRCNNSILHIYSGDRAEFIVGIVIPIVIFQSSFLLSLRIVNSSAISLRFADYRSVRKGEPVPILKCT